MAPETERDYEAEADLEALQRAAVVQSDSGRLQRLHRYLADKKESLDEAMQQLGSNHRGFDGAVRSKRSFS